MSSITLVRERSGVQISAAAPSKPFIYRLTAGNPEYIVRAEPSENSHDPVAKNWQDGRRAAYEDSLSVSRLECTTELYRFYDPEGALLYVGISNQFDQRFVAHSNGAQWFPQARFVRTEIFKERGLCEIAEKHAIKAENHRHNTQRLYAGNVSIFRFKEYVAGQPDTLSGLHPRWYEIKNWEMHGIKPPP